jgi:hypothetical protein
LIFPTILAFPAKLLSRMKWLLDFREYTYKTH